jgi:outer membrane lipoprotein-sorting protein
MKRLITTLIALFLILSNGIVQAQSLDDILEKHFKAIGHEKLLEKQTYIIKANINQMGMDLPMLMKIKRPNKFRMEMDMQGQKMVQVFDGDKGWLVAPWMSPEPQALEGPQLKQALAQADIDGELYNYTEKGHTADLIGKVMVDDKEAYRIKLTSDDGTVKNYYINADNYLVTKVKSKVSVQGQEAEIEQNMSEYEEIGGVMIARKIESKSPMGTQVITFQEISFDGKIDDSIFEKP